MTFTVLILSQRSRSLVYYRDSVHFLVVESKVWAGGSYGKSLCVRYFFRAACPPFIFSSLVFYKTKEVKNNFS